MRKVFVIDMHGKTCLPCHPARARKLLKEGRATIKSVVPYTIQLNKAVNNPIGSFTIGIDDGAKEVGMAVVNEVTKEVVFKGTIKLRQDVSRKMLQRSRYRKTRRSRNLRYREARFDNRGTAGWIAPSIKQKKDSILRVVHDLATRVTLTKAIVEQGQFDIGSLAAGRKLKGKEYSIPNYEGRNFRAKVLWRDKYQCQHCKGTQSLHAHHVRHKSQGGTNTVQNGITLCEKCHTELHAGLWVLKGKLRHFKYPAHLQIGKKYLVNALLDTGMIVDTCLGFMTSFWRKNICLSKTHFNDAISMVCRDYLPALTEKDYQIIPKRKKIWEDNPSKTCEEKSGFRHFDLVKAAHKTRGTVIGSIRSLAAKSITLRTAWDDNFHVSYNKTKHLWRFDGIVYV